MFLRLNCACLVGARLAQSVEHETLNLRVVSSSPTLGLSSSLFFVFSQGIFYAYINLEEVPACNVKLLFLYLIVDMVDFQVI